MEAGDMSNELERIGTALSPALQQAGVGLVRQADGYVAITGLDKLRATHHVLTPVESVAQADPFYVPSVNQIRLNSEDHSYYDKQTQKRALNKNGLLLLAQAAGMTMPLTFRIPQANLKEGQIGYQAVVEVRRPDGTMVRHAVSRVVDVGMEREKVKQRCTNANGELDKGKFFAQWGKEADVLEAKVETKAVLRAIRQALAVRGGGYSEKDFEKPFVAISYNFRPDYSDPEIRKMAMERGMGASNQLYGGQETPFGAATIAAAPPPPAPVEAPPIVDERSIDEEEAEDAEVVEVEFAAPEAPEVDPEKARLAAEGGALQITAGKFAGKSVADIATEDPAWLRMIAANANDADARVKLQAFVELNLP